MILFYTLIILYSFVFFWFIIADPYLNGPPPGGMENDPLFVFGWVSNETPAINGV